MRVRNSFETHDDIIKKLQLSFWMCTEILHGPIVVVFKTDYALGEPQGCLSNIYSQYYILNLGFL